ncbi:MAG: oligosaccharide flippase family protein, partial [Planctomycetota bacterium]
RKVTATFSYFSIAVFLARWLGVSEYGVYAYIMAWITLLVVPAVLGLDNLLIRNIAAYRVESMWGLMAGLLRWANRAALVASLGLALLAAIVSWALSPHINQRMLFAFWVVLPLLPLVTLTRLRQAAMQGLHRVVVGQLPELLILPMLFISLIGGAYLVVGESLTAPQAIGMNVVAAGVAFLIGTYLLYKALPPIAKKASPDYQTRVWLTSALPLLFVGVIGVFNYRIDTLMLGALKGAEPVGIYVVASRGAELIVFIMSALIPALAPTIAGLYAGGEIDRLQKVTTICTRVTFFFSLPIAVGMIAFGYWFLVLFGSEFTQGQRGLAILGVGQLSHLVMGPVAWLLVMTSHERVAAIGIGISAVLNVILNAILIPPWGLEGAATATTTSTILWSILMAIWVHRTIGIHSTVFGRITLRA